MKRGGEDSILFKRLCVRFHRLCQLRLRSYGSRVEFRDDATGQVRQVTLVYPVTPTLRWEEFRYLQCYPYGKSLMALASSSMQLSLHKRELTLQPLGAHRDGAFLLGWA
jgi:hypothetical protein